MGCCSSQPKRETTNGRFCGKDSDEMVHLLPGEELSMPFFEWIISTSPELQMFSNFNDMWNDFQRHVIKTMYNDTKGEDETELEYRSRKVSEIFNSPEIEVPQTSTNSSKNLEDELPTTTNAVSE